MGQPCINNASSPDSFVNRGIITFNLLNKYGHRLGQSQLEYKLKNILNQIPGIQVSVAYEKAGEHYKLVLAGKDGELLKQVVKKLNKSYYFTASVAIRLMKI